MNLRGRGHCCRPNLVYLVLNQEYVRFAVVMVNMRVVVFWDMTQCGLEE
jgi:hypothetical protein